MIQGFESLRGFILIEVIGKHWLCKSLTICMKQLYFSLQSEVSYTLFSLFTVPQTESEIIHYINYMTNTYVVPRVKNEIAKHSFSYAGPKQWNDLPDSIRSISSLPVFKKQLKTFLFSNNLGIN